MPKDLSNKSKIILSLIFLLALFLRFYKITEYPDSFDGDEAAFGYYGYSLGKERTDEYGNKYPLYFESIGDYKYPMYAYFTIIPVRIFGLNEFSSRFWSAFSGSLLVIVIFFLSRIIFENESIAFFSSLSIAISPWHILFSRGTYEANLALFFTTLGFLLLVEFLKKEFDPRKLAASFLLFLTAIYTYSAQRAFLCSFLFIFPIFFWKETVKKRKWLTLFCLIFIITTFLSSIPWQSRARAESIGIFKSDRKYLIDEAIHEDGLAFPGKGSIIITRIFHNKCVFLGFDFLYRYLSHFDPNFLFIYGDKLRPEYSVPSFGLLYLIDAPFLILGLLNLIKQKTILKFSPLLWLFTGIIPSALTIETPNAIRSLTILPAIAIILGIGFESFLNFIAKNKKKIVIPVTIAIFIFYFGNFSFGLHQYLVHKFYHQPWYTDYGAKEMVKETTKLASNYKAIVMPDDPYILFLFLQQNFTFSIPKNGQTYT